MEPLPLVPATSTDGNARSGRPSLSQMAPIDASPSFMPLWDMDSSLASDGRFMRSRKETTPIPPLGLADRVGRLPVLTLPEQLQATDERLLHLRAVDQEVEHPVLEEEL